MVADADGSNPRVLVEAPGGRACLVTRRSQHRLYEETPDGSVIAVVKVDGSGERIVVHGQIRYQASEPAWRPAVPLPSARRRSCA